MRRFRHPETGETVHASEATAERLLAGSGDGGSEQPATSATRKEWNAYAESIGLDPEEYGSKGELIEAVESA